MPKLVELTQDMRPKRAGESVLLDDGIADHLLETGLAINPRDRFGVPLDPKHVDPPFKPRHLRRFTKVVT